MKKNNAVIVLGVLFGLALIGIGFLYFVLSIALAFGGYGWFVYSSFVMWGMALVAIVGSCFARSKVVVSRIALAVSVITYIASIICLYCIPNVSVGLYLILLCAVLALGVVPLVVSFLIKKAPVDMAN